MTSKTITENIGKNTVTWIVDADGLPISASGTLRETFSGSKRSSSEVTAQTNAAKAGQTGDQGGHVVGHRFVLNQGAKNLFPQEGNFNMGAFKTLENDYARYISKGYEVHFKHELMDFDSITKRPGTIRVEYTVKDKNGISLIIALLTLKIKLGRVIKGKYINE